MICMEAGGMKKKINEIIPLIVLAVWMAVCYPVCDKVEEFEFSYKFV